MATCFSDIFTARQLVTLASIVQVGDAAYRDLMETQRPMFAHPYLRTLVVAFEQSLFRCNAKLKVTNPISHLSSHSVTLSIISVYLSCGPKM